MENQSPARAQHGPPARALGIIRLAIVSGVALFAAVTVFLLNAGRIDPDPELRGPLNLAVLGVCVACALTINLLRSRRDAAATRAQRTTLSITGWAVGEAAAMVSIVSTFLSGALTTLLAGAAILALALAFFPVPPDEG